MDIPNYSKTYLMKALQPIHIGSGGYQLERIDNKIVRDEENIPIIPGTALSGAARSFLALKEGKKCGGRNGCGEDDCLVCLAFGFTKENEKKARQGMVQLYDARLLLFPVATMLGPVWVTTRRRLIDFLQYGENEIIKKAYKELNDLPEIKDNSYILLGEFPEHQKTKKLNLGWLMFHSYDDDKRSIKEDSKIKEVFRSFFHEEVIASRVICISESLFIRVVEDNLEKRTSVAINPDTNTADEGALFTYEAVPSTSYFYFNVTYNNPIAFVSMENLNKCFNISVENDALNNYLTSLASTFSNTFSYFKLFGLGGMTTRGFGRVEIREVF